MSINTYTFTLVDLQNIPDILNQLNFKLLECNQLQQGALGSVIFVINTQNSQKYALKIQKLVDSNGSYSLNQLKFYKNESDILVKLQSERVVKFQQAFEIQDMYYIIQMSMPECSLDQYVQKKKIDQEDFIKIALQILEGIEFVHEKNFILHDLKPNNILVDGVGNIYLCDFGSSKSILNEQIIYQLFTMKSSKSPKGNLCFFPPEVQKEIFKIDNEQKINQIKILQSKEGDIWAYGLVLSFFRGLTFKQIALLFFNQEYHQAIDKLYIKDNEKKLLKYILDKNPNTRPTTQQIKQYIHDIFIKKIVDPPLPIKQIKITQNQQYYQSHIDLNSDQDFQQNNLKQKDNTLLNIQQQYHQSNKQINQYNFQQYNQQQLKQQQDQNSNNSYSSLNQVNKDNKIVEQQQNQEQINYINNDQINNVEEYGFKDFTLDFEVCKDIIFIIIQSISQIINIINYYNLQSQDQQKIFCISQMVIYLLYLILKAIKYNYLKHKTDQNYDNISKIWTYYYLFETILDMITLTSLVFIQNQNTFMNSIYFINMFLAICLQKYSDQYFSHDKGIIHYFIIIFLLPELCYKVNSEPFGQIIFYKGLAFIITFELVFFMLIQKKLIYRDDYLIWCLLVPYVSYIFSFVIFQEDGDRSLSFYIEFIVYTLMPLIFPLIVFIDIKQDFSTLEMIFNALNFWLSSYRRLVQLIWIQFYMSIIFIFLFIYRNLKFKNKYILNCYQLMQIILIVLASFVVFYQIKFHYIYSAIFNCICLVLRLLFFYEQIKRCWNNYKKQKQENMDQYKYQHQYEDKYYQQQ